MNSEFFDLPGFYFVLQDNHCYIIVYNEGTWRIDDYNWNYSQLLL